MYHYSMYIILNKIVKIIYLFLVMFINLMLFVKLMGFHTPGKI